MNYYLDLFSPQTYEAFRKSSKTISGFRIRQRNAAAKIKPGDRLVCYMTRMSRWIGVLEVLEGPFEDKTPIFLPDEDPFVVRFRVKPLVLLEVEKAVPIHDAEVWNKLSFTRDHDTKDSTWTGHVRSSLVRIEDEDGAFLDELLRRQASGGRLHPFKQEDYDKFLNHTVQRADRAVAVTVPEDTEEEIAKEAPDTRESIRIQAMLAHIGSKMGMKIWLPRSDRGRVLKHWDDKEHALLDRLPLNYDEATIKTIEQIDVLWLRGRAITRAFEVEHTTAIYSGILRMADLLALQPNMDIRLHIVAPKEKREKVFQEIRRPVFSLLERKPLAEVCTFLPYDAVEELAGQDHLSHLSDSVIDEFEEEAE